MENNNYHPPRLFLTSYPSLIHVSSMFSYAFYLSLFISLYIMSLYLLLLLLHILLELIFSSLILIISFFNFKRRLAIMSAHRNVEHFLSSVTTHIESNSTTRPNSPIPIIHNHIDYYLPGGDLFIRVHNTLFRVHSYFFVRESEAWRNLIGSTTKGKTANDPIVIHDDICLLPRITPADFANLLWVFYNPRYIHYDATEETWLKIQQIAVQWMMNGVLNLAGHELDKIMVDHLEFYTLDAGCSSPDPDDEAIRIHIEDDHSYGS